MSLSGWFHGVRPQAAPRVRLFCLPHSGGGASFFRPWQAVIGPDVEVWPIQPPGRETRFRDAPYDAYGPYVHDLLEAMRPHIADRPYALFGHSLGAGLAFELCRGGRQQGLRAPLHLFVSAHAAPHLRPKDLALAELGDAEFIAAIKEMGGTPREVFEHPELVAMMLSILRADYRLFSSYLYDESAPLDVPVSVFGGTKDPGVSHQDLDEWERHSRRFMGVTTFDGAHFYLNDHRAEVLAAIAKALAANQSNQ